MQKVIGVVATLAGVLVACLSSRASESTSEYSVQVSVAVQKAPPQITLNWPQDGCVGVNAYTVYRKKAEDAWWGPGTHLATTATSYTDTNINLGIPYEYQVVKTTELYAGYGYVCAGIEVPQVENRGKLLLVIDNTYLSELSRELGQLEQDLQGDGWSVLRLVVGRNDSVLKVKSLIRAEYRADPRNVKCVFLFGHVPVPYRAISFQMAMHLITRAPGPAMVTTETWTVSGQIFP